MSFKIIKFIDRKISIDINLDGHVNALIGRFVSIRNEHGNEASKYCVIILFYLFVLVFCFWLFNEIEIYEFNVKQHWIFNHICYALSELSNLSSVKQLGTIDYKRPKNVSWTHSLSLSLSRSIYLSLHSVALWIHSKKRIVYFCCSIDRSIKIEWINFSPTVGQRKCALLHTHSRRKNAENVCKFVFIFEKSIDSFACVFRFYFEIYNE